MADIDGLVKLHDALYYLDLIAISGTSDDAGHVELDIFLADGTRQVIHTSGFMDGKSSIVWVHLPLVTVEDIVCQGRPQPAERTLDGRPLTDHANPRSGTSNRLPEPAQRRAPDLCSWHDGFHTVKNKPRNGSWAECFECGRYIPRGGKNTGKDFTSAYFENDDHIVMATVVSQTQIEEGRPDPWRELNASLETRAAGGTSTTRVKLRQTGNQQT